MKCPICSKGKLKFHSFAKDYWVTNEEFRLLKCDVCQVVCTDVQPSEGFFEKYYKALYYAHTADFLKMSMREQLQRDSVRLRLGEKLRLLEKVKAILLGRVISVNLPAVRNGRILDVGCGAGKLLRVASSVGYECHGAEPSIKARKILEESGFKAYPSIFDVSVPPLYFDVIVFNHSLEHLPDPVAAIKKALEILKEDGTLIISVPNFQSNERKVFGNFWRHVDVPRHLFHFSPDTLDYIAKDNGLSVQKCVFKFWGIPNSALRIAKEQHGSRAYMTMAAWFMKQVTSIVFLKQGDYGQVMSYYFTKVPKLALPHQQGV